MGARRLWWLLSLLPAWPGGMLILRLGSSGRFGQALTAVALAAVIAAVLLAGLGWGLRGAAPAPPWRPRPWFGAALVVGLLVLVAAGTAAVPLAAAGCGVGAAAVGWGLWRWSARGLPPGFAPRLTGWARVLASAAAPLWVLALAHRSAALLAAGPATIGASAYLGILSLAGGAGLGEWLRPALFARPHGRDSRRIGIRASGSGGGTPSQPPSAKADGLSTRVGGR